jgi:hypothetical protein
MLHPRAADPKSTDFDFGPGSVRPRVVAGVLKPQRDQ